MSKRVLVVCRNAAEAEPYVRAVEATGATPVLEEARPGLVIGGCDGLLLTGGSDVNPERYGEPRHPETQPADDERDAIEGKLIDEALRRDIPVLAICRGMQMLNVHLGGTLIQHLPSTEHHRRKTPDKGLPAHRVNVESGTKLASIAGKDRLEVNSRHHQAVNRLGRDLRISARDSSDGVIEAIELPGSRFVVAVQWHPENQAPSDPDQRKIFQSFTESL